MEQYPRRQQEFSCVKGNPFSSTNFISCINHTSANNFQRHSNNASDGDGGHSYASNTNDRNSSVWKSHDLSQASTLPNRKVNKPPLIHKRFKLSNSNKQVELSFKNRKYFEFCSTSWATHRSAKCLPPANINQKFPHSCNLEYEAGCSLSFYNSNKYHVDNIFIKNESRDLNRKSSNGEGSSSQCPINFTSQNNFGFSTHPTPLLTFKNYPLLETPKDSVPSPKVHLMNKHFDEHGGNMLKDFCCPSNGILSLKCEISNVAISDSFLNLGEGKQSSLEESPDILNLYNCQFSDFDESICSSLENKEYDDLTFNSSLAIDSRQKSKRPLQQVTSSLSDPTAHVQTLSFCDSTANSDTTEFNYNCERTLKIQEDRIKFLCPSKWKTESNSKFQPLRGNSSTLNLNNQSNLVFTENCAPHYEPNSYFDKKHRKCYASDNLNLFKKSTKNEKSYKRHKTSEISTKRPKSQRCQVSESQERLFGEDWLRNNSDIIESFEKIRPRPDLSDFITTSITDSWLPQLDVEMEEEVVETMEHRDLCPITQSDSYAPNVHQSQENSSENFSSFIDYFLESWYDDDIACPFSEEILKNMEEENDRLKNTQS